MLWRDERETSPPALVAIGVLFLIVALSFGRTFQSDSYLAWAIPALAAGAAFAWAWGKKSLLLSFLGLGAVQFVALPALFARELTALLLPTTAAWRLVWTLMASGLTGVAQEVAPVAPEPRFMAVLWTAFSVVGFLGAAWVVVERPVGAVVTGLGVVAFAGAVGEGPGRLGYTVAAVAAAGAFFLADGRHRIQTWSSRRVAVPGHFGVPTLGAATLIALLGTAVVSGAAPLLDLEGALRSRVVVIKPLSDVKRQLDQEPPIEVMRVRAGEPAYWRLTALDTYTESEWVLEAEPARAGNGPIRTPEPPTSGSVLLQEYSITSLLAPWLPSAYAASSIDTPVPFEIDRNSQTLLVRGDTVPGLRYSVTSQLPSAPVDSSAEPEEVSDEGAFGDLAQQIVAGAGAQTALQKALAIERYFRGFRYDENVAGGHTRERLAQFLAEQSGYCEQFAATMTLMLRALDIPARVGVGFLPGGTAGDPHEFIVTTKEAHAWVEVNLPESGWSIFDPTPGRGTPASGQQDEQVQVTPAPLPGGQTAPTPTPVPSVVPGEGGSDDDGSGTNPWPFVLPVLGLAVGGSIPGAKAVRRSLRRSGTDSRATSLGAWEELVDRCADLGLTWPRAQTPWGFVGRAFARGEGRRHAGIVADVAVRAQWAADAPSPAEAAAAWDALEPALAALRREMPWYRRLWAVFTVRTLLPPGGLRSIIRLERLRAKPA